MKKLFFFAAIVCSMLAVQTAVAQNPVTTLEHNGTTQVFYGESSFANAYNASVNGDQIYLSAGYFTPPTSIARGVKIIGAGHFPIEGKQTKITAGLTIAKGADSLRLEGLYISGDINYYADNSINYVKVIRCKLINANFNSISATASKNFCSYEECFISGSISFYYFGNNFLLRNSIVSGSLNNIIGNALIDGNIFLGSGTTTTVPTYTYPFTPKTIYTYVFNEIKYSIIQNNIFIGGLLFDATTGNTIKKNIFVSSGFDTYNYSGIQQANIFVNQTGNTINYSHDYHLRTPATYIGTDGTQVGLYGGIGFKEKGLPSNPAIVSKTISPKTDANGNLQINISVKAQDN